MPVDERLFEQTFDAEAKKKFDPQHLVFACERQILCEGGGKSSRNCRGLNVLNRGNILCREIFTGSFFFFSLAVTLLAL